jgi:hypothetical protein
MMPEDRQRNKSDQPKKKIRAGHAAEKLKNEDVPPPESP